MASPSRPKPGDLVMVEWLDIVEDPGWQGTPSPKAELAECRSVGWLVSWTRRSVVLVRTFGPEGVAGDKITFPRGCVTSWSVIVGSE